MFATDGPSVAPGREVALGLLAAGILYFAPTLVAVARHRGAAPLTFSFNLILGWTGVGWVLAWFLALADRRLHIHVMAPVMPPTAMPAFTPPMQAPSVALAPDGRHWWDGYVWRDGWQVAPRGALRSRDGAHWFSGAYWVPQAAHVGADIDSGSLVQPPRTSPEQPWWWEV
jgi:Superinfection immunity protein